METHYQKIYTGNFLTVQLLVSELEKLNITPIVKDESESARLAGFGTFTLGLQELYVHNNNLDKAIVTIEAALASMQSQA